VYLHDDENAFAYLVAETGRVYGIQSDYVIKDYFIYEFLKELVGNNPLVVFKGGTALSKCYKVIRRFSEDADLGMETSRVTEGQRRKLKQSIVDTVNTLGLEISNIDETKSRRSFNRYLIPLVSYDDSPNTLMVETALMTPVWPTQTREISSFIHDYCVESAMADVIDEFGLSPFSLTVSSLERTFVDKIYAICDYFLAEEIPARQSRHIYDLHKLLSEVSLDDAMVTLLEQVRQDRESSAQCPSAQQDVNLAALLTDIVRSKAYEEDYRVITDPLLYENVSYDTAVEALKTISDFLSRRPHPY
jgi:predicted nucleotidyltransferase component of viral defense system